MYKSGKNIFSICFLLSFTFVQINAQEANKKPDNFPFVYATYAFQLPGGDLSKRFGVSNEIGGGAGYKTGDNWIIGAEATYIFGSDLKENPLANLLNSNSEITNMYGEPAQINMREAGMQLKIMAGRIISLNKQNENSGIYIRGAMGLLQHKIYIENNGNNTPQILGEYRKGYDRLCNGLAISEFFGWQNFSNLGGYHFLIGFEFTQGFTKNRRTWDYAINTKIEGSRLDLLYSIKAAWFIPFRQRQATGYFYY